MQGKRARWLRLLEPVSIVYVALPFAIFQFGWLKLWIALPVAVVLGFGCWYASRDLEPLPASDPLAAPSRRANATLIALIVLVGVLVLYSGAGGFAYQYQDYTRHNAFMADLIERPWPLAFAETPPGGKPGVLAFYIANALVPSAIGKVLGWGAANFASFLWTWLGVSLAVLWFLRVVGRASFAIGLLFLFFGGLDVVGSTLLLGWPTDPTWFLGNWMVEYALASTPEAARIMGRVFWFFPSNLSFVFYAPQHILGPWVCVLIIVYDAVRRDTCRRAIFLWSLVFLWSAFSFIGLIPFVGLAVIATRRHRLFSFANTAAAGCIGILTFLFIGSNNQHFPHGFLWERQNLAETAGLLLLFYVLEFGLYAILRPRMEADDPNRIHAAWWWVALTCLLLAPWYVLGVFNDLTTKVGIPSLIVLQVFIAITLLGARGRSQRIRAGVLIGLLVVGSAASLTDIARGLKHGLHLGPPPLSKVGRTNEVPGPAGQLFSDGTSFFWTHLARPPILE